MTTTYWRDQISHVILSSGDMIVDSLTGHYGLLIVRKKKDVGYESESSIYFWSVKWSYVVDDYRDAPNPDWVEEDGLKMSILVGYYDLYPKNKGKI